MRRAFVFGVAVWMMACGGETESSDPTDSPRDANAGGDVADSGEPDAAEGQWQPPQLVILPVKPYTTDDLTVTVQTPARRPDGSDYDGPMVWSWTRDGAPEALDGSVIPSAITARGEVWQVTGRPAVDGAPTVFAAVTIGNSAPDCAAATITPAGGTVSTSFACACDGWSDADGDTAADTCAFYAGAAILPIEGCVVPADALAAGTMLRCELTPHDGTDAGETVSSEPVFVSGGPPTAPTSAVLSPTVADVTTEMTCQFVLGTDPDGTPVTPSITWVVGDFENPGSTSNTVEAGALERASGESARRGDAVRCRVRTQAGEELSEPTESNSVTLVNAPPKGGAVLIAPAMATEATTLSCQPSGAKDPDGDAITWSWTWTVDGQSVDEAADSTLDGTWFDKKQVIRCSAIPSDGELDGQPVESKVAVTVANTLPTLESALVSPGVGNAATAFTCEWFGWADPDPADAEDVLIEWLAGESGETVIAGETGETLVPDSLDPLPEALRCRVTPRNGMVFGEPVVSPAAQVSAVPTLMPATVSISAPSGADGPITCQLASPASGPDGITYTYHWSVAGGAVFDGDAVLPASEVDACESVSCSVTASAGD